MNEERRTGLDQVLPSGLRTVLPAMIPELWLSRHRDEFLTLFLEAHKAFLNGCPRASIIVAGESLLRLLFARIERHVLVEKVDELKVGKLRIRFEDVLVTGIPDLTFSDAIGLLQQKRILSESALQVARAVKDLRNIAAHSQFPLLDDWDPDEPREGRQWLWDRSFVFPEGYRFFTGPKGTGMFTFDCRKMPCGSLRKLDTEERFAAI